MSTSDLSPPELIAYRTTHACDMKLVAALRGRNWMDATYDGFANRCLPMRMASQAGWMLLNDRRVRAKWAGGAATDAITIDCEGAPPFAAISHFGGGILTFVIPFLFRTPPGISLLFRGPPNMPKDAIAPLEGLVETDWAVAGASVNWQFTRAGVWVEFAALEPICMLVPQRLDLLEGLQPVGLELAANPATRTAHAIWNLACRAFNEKLRKRDPDALRQGWLRNYFHGTAPHAAPEPMPEAHAHRTKLLLREFDGMQPVTPVQPRASGEAQPHRSAALQALGICPHDR